VGIAERRERDREGIRRKILDAARHLFAEEGYARVTMRRIAQAIEYSVTTIYHHFKDKDDLVLALCHEDFGQLLGALRTAHLPVDPVERIRALGRAYTRFALAHPNHYRFMFMTPVTKPHPEGQPQMPGDLAFNLLREAVDAAQAAGRFRPGDPQAAAQVLWSAVHGVSALLITLPAPLWPNGPAAPDLVEQVIDVTTRGLMAEPAA
jgi:AcrR family transcriptional regulator